MDNISSCPVCGQMPKCITISRFHILCCGSITEYHAPVQTSGIGHRTARQAVQEWESIVRDAKASNPSNPVNPVKETEQP